MRSEEQKWAFLNGNARKRLLVLNGILATGYFIAISFGFTHGNALLFYLLIAGELFHLFQILGYCATVWDTRLLAPYSRVFRKPVDVFITVCGEPVDIVRQTIRCARDMDYPNFMVYVLNDGYAAGKDNWHEIEILCKEEGVVCVTREVPGGAKAGNINNGLKVSRSPYVAVFDADHAPHTDFLSDVMGYFVDRKLGFVQTPQYYKNHSFNIITQTAWDQQTLFFGPIMSGKNRYNAAFMCGTNMVFSRVAIERAGGMCEFNIAEDFLTSLFMHARGWRSVYVPKVLAEGLAPEDFLSYYKQQYRWTRGSLEVIFKYNPFFMTGLTWAQAWQYFISASYYMTGIVVLIDIMLPIVFLYFGLTAITTSTMMLALIFLPYIAVNLIVLQLSGNYSYTFNAISYSLSSFILQIRAIAAVLLSQDTAFSVTPKNAQSGNYLYLVSPQILYVAVMLCGLVVGCLREGLSASYLANASWGVVSAVIFAPFIKSAAPTDGVWMRKYERDHYEALSQAKLLSLLRYEVDGGQ